MNLLTKEHTGGCSKDNHGGLTRNVEVKAFKGVKLQQRNASRELTVVQLAKGCPFVFQVLGFLSEKENVPCLVYERGGRT